MHKRIVCFIITFLIIYILFILFQNNLHTSSTIGSYDDEINVYENSYNKDIVLKDDTLDGYIEYFKECNKNYIFNKEHILNNRFEKEKVIYVTIDDGPCANMEKILDILKEKNVQATIFVAGTKYPDLLKRAKSEGHTIAIHCANHEYGNLYIDELSYLKDLYIIQSFLYDTIGEYVHMLRFPGGSNNLIALNNNQLMKKIIKIVTDVGFEYYDWNLSVTDSYCHENPLDIFYNFIKGLESERNEIIVLMHDLYIQTPLMLPYIIDYGIEKGYTFKPITDQTIPIHFIDI